MTGALYLVFGMYMGGSSDHTLAPLHAHITLLGFVLMTLFGLTDRISPALAGGWMATAHFRLHQAGAPFLPMARFLMMTRRVA